MFVSHQWLADNINDPVIIDTRPKIAYSYGHIPNSISLVVDQLIQISSTGAHLAPDPQKTSELLGNLGIDNDKTVIVTGELMDPSVFRIAWTLQYLGQKNTKILDASIGTWQSLGLEITKTSKKNSPTQFIPQIQTNIRIESADCRDYLARQQYWTQGLHKSSLGATFRDLSCFRSLTGLARTECCLNLENLLETYFHKEKFRVTRK